MATRRTRLTLTIGVVVALVVAAGVVGWRALYDTARSHFASQTCTVGQYSLATGQAAVASTMVGAVTQYRVTLPERAAVLVLAAGLQESHLSNVAPGAGDRDSVGVLQQRPSQGWGSVKGQPDTIAARTQRLRDVGEATKEFLNKLVKVDGWQTRPLADAVQAVQISADGSLYAQHEPEAQALADALTGRQPAAITCDFAAPTQVAAPTVVAGEARTQLGIDTPAATSTGARVPGARWQTAAWFVANADRLGIERVDYAGRTWSRGGEWSADETISAAAVVATMYRREG
jgi:hypothetical protein